MGDVLKHWQCAFDAKPKKEKKKKENGGNISKAFYFHEVNVCRLNGNNNIKQPLARRCKNNIVSKTGCARLAHIKLGKSDWLLTSFRLQYLRMRKRCFLQ